MKVAKLFAVLVITALVLSLAGSAAAAPPAENPGKGPPDFDKVVFVHYPKGEAPGKPPGTPGKGPQEGDYVYDGYHWADTSLPVHYLVNLTGSGDPGTFLDGIQATFQTWEEEPNSDMDFQPDGTTNRGISSLNDQMDSYNVVGWANISADYPNAIAVTIFWYNVLTKEVVEVDVAMNSDPYFVWWQNSSDDEVWDFADTLDKFDVDVQNIMTHEAGHWLVLGDLYADANSEKTMYGYAAELELKKRSLDPGDEAGIQAIYPITEEVPTGAIAGTVTDADTGNPIKGATVTADGYSTTTASDGTYTVADLAVGSYTVTASATGYTEQSKPAEVLENQTTVLNFALSPTTTPTGTMHVAAIDMWYTTAGPNRFIYTKVTIHDADVAGVSQATVYLEMTLPDGSTASGSGETNGDGTVTFKLKSQQTGTYESTVTDVVKGGWTYDPGANVETSDSISVP